MDQKKERDNFALVVDCITRTLVFQLQISLPLICRLDVLRMWEPRLWYHPVTPRSRGYGEVIATIYVGRKYPHVYRLSISTGKNQSTKASGALYIPTYEYNYKVITWSDTILQEYYITDRRKYENTRRCTSMNSTKEVQSHNRKNSRAEQGELGRMGLWTVCRRSKLLLHLSDQQPRESPSSKLQDLDMRIQRSQNSPASGDANTRWRARMSTHVSIKPNHKHA